MIAVESATVVQVLDLVGLEAEQSQPGRPGAPGHRLPDGLALSSQRSQMVRLALEEAGVLQTSNPRAIAPT